MSTNVKGIQLPLRAAVTTAVGDILNFNFSPPKEKSLEISCESCAKQTIYMIYQNLLIPRREVDG